MALKTSTRYRNAIGLNHIDYDASHFHHVRIGGDILVFDRKLRLYWRDNRRASGLAIESGDEATLYETAANISGARADIIEAMLERAAFGFVIWRGG